MFSTFEQKYQNQYSLKFRLLFKDLIKKKKLASKNSPYIKSLWTSSDS